MSTAAEVEARDRDKHAMAQKVKELASDSPAEYDAIIKAARELKAQAVERIEAEFRAKAAALAAEAQALGLPMRRRAKKAKA